jgi:hypothetical protein
MYDFNRVRGQQSIALQPLQRFIGHTDVVTAVAAGEGMFKDCFLSGQWSQAVCGVEWVGCVWGAGVGPATASGFGGRHSITRVGRGGGGGQ